MIPPFVQVAATIVNLLRSIRLVGACLVAAASAGCVSRAVVLDRNITAVQASEKAIVIVSASHDIRAGHGTIATYFMDGGTSNKLRVSSATTPIDPPIKNQYLDKVGHVYVLEVTPGHHEFTSWIMHVRDRDGGSPAALAPLGFDVAKGEVLYLGNLDMRLRMGETWIGHHEVATAAWAEVLDQSAIDVAIAEAANPAIAGKARVALLRLGPWGRALQGDPDAATSAAGAAH
jgi:hypothetical protein